MLQTEKAHAQQQRPGMAERTDRLEAAASEASRCPPTGLEAQLVVLLPFVVIKCPDPHFRPRGGVLVKGIGVPVGIRGGEWVVGLIV